MEDAGLHGDAVKEGVDVGAELVAHALQLRVAGELQLVAQPLVAVERHPVVRPVVHLRRGAARVCHREAEAPRGRVWVGGRRQVHGGELPPELRARGAPAKVEVLHHDEAARLAQLPEVVHLGDAQRLRVIHGVERERLPLEHAHVVPRRHLHEILAAVLGGVDMLRGPVAAAVVRLVHDLPAGEVVLDPLHRALRAASTRCHGLAPPSPRRRPHCGPAQAHRWRRPPPPNEPAVSRGRRCCARRTRRQRGSTRQGLRGGWHAAR
mmetsp:Transcript_1496/g.3633  ORF Transcript_1496/g.3633 Transcript_1496/m.3633 type:complete len:265 (-) Transcript_1496:84-878(-)